MTRVQIQVLPERREFISILLKAIPRQGELLCFNYGSHGEFKVTVEEVVHIIPHNQLSQADPEVILKVLK